MDTDGVRELHIGAVFTVEFSRARGFIPSVVMPPHTEPVPAFDPSQTRWFADEVLPHNAQLKAYLRGAFPGVRDVDDVVQESHLRIWRRQMVRPIQSVKGFLFQVARHLALDTVRRKNAAPLLETADLARLNVADETANVAESCCTRDEIDLLFAAIDGLPARCREIVILRKIAGVSQKEIARRLGLSEATVQVQVGRGLRRCAEYMRAHAAAPESRK